MGRLCSGKRVGSITALVVVLSRCIFLPVFDGLDYLSVEEIIHWKPLLKHRKVFKSSLLKHTFHY